MARYDAFGFAVPDDKVALKALVDVDRVLTSVSNLGTLRISC